MNNKKQKQLGMAGITFVLLLLIGAFFVNIALVSLPVYLDNFAVNSSLTSLEKDGDLDRDDDREIMTRLLKRLGVNSVKYIKNEDINITRGSGKPIVIKIDYEVREGFFGNVDVVYSFHEMIELSNR